MSAKKNKEFKNQMNEVIRNSSNPWEMQQNIQKQLQSMEVHYSPPGKQEKHDRAETGKLGRTAGADTNKQEKHEQTGTVQMPDYDINQLMNKLGDKMPPGIKQMLDQFIPIIPSIGAMDDPKLKKEIKKKMKNLRTMFQSPYE